MSAEDDDWPGRVGSRLRRRRALPESADGREDGGLGGEPYEPGEYEFGYGGWSVTLDGLRMPESERTVVPVRSGGEPAARLRLRARPQPEADEADEDAPAPRIGPRLAAAAERAISGTDGAPERQRTGIGPAERPRRPSRGSGASEDRPIIDPPMRRRGGGAAAAAAPVPREPRVARRRPMGESPARPEGTRGVRKRRTQRIEGGGTVVIEDQLYSLVDWSAGGIAIRSEGQLYRIGDRRKLELEIDLDDYAVNLDLEAEVVNRSSERTGWQFVAPTATQLEVLGALTRASLAGESFRAPASAPVQRRRVAGARGGARLLGAAAALLSLPLNIVVIAIAAGAALFAIDDDFPARLAAALAPPPAVRSQHAAVAVDVVTVETDVAGFVVEWRAEPGDTLLPGEAVVVISDAVPDGPVAASEEALPAEAQDAGEAPVAGEDPRADPATVDGDGAVAAAESDGPVRTVLTSPCACTLLRRSVAAGEAVAAGDGLARLVLSEPAGYVEAVFEAARAPRPGDAVAVDVPRSGERFAGIVEEIGPPAPGQEVPGLPRAVLGEDGALLARIRTSPAVPSALVGAPAIVTVTPDA